MLSLLFNTLDECLFLFCSEGVIVKDVKVYELDDSEFKIVLGWYVMQHSLKLRRFTHSMLIMRVRCAVREKNSI